MARIPSSLFPSPAILRSLKTVFPMSKHLLHSPNHSRQTIDMATAATPVRFSPANVTSRSRHRREKGCAREYLLGRHRLGYSSIHFLGNFLDEERSALPIDSTSTASTDNKLKLPSRPSIPSWPRTRPRRRLGPGVASSTPSASYSLGWAWSQTPKDLATGPVEAV